MAETEFQIEAYAEPTPVQKPKRTRKQFLRDYALYLLIGLSVAIIPLVVVSLGLERVLWILGACVTFAAVLVVSVREERALLRRRRTWAVAAAFIPFHFAAFYLIHRYSTVRVYYTLLFWVELAIGVDLFRRGGVKSRA